MRPDEGKADMRQYIYNTVTRLRPRKPAPALATSELPSIEVRLAPRLDLTWGEKLQQAAVEQRHAQVAIDLQSDYPGRRP